MNKIKYNTLQLGALLQDIQRLLPEKRFDEQLSATVTRCPEIDHAGLYELLTSSQHDNVSNILWQAEKIVGLRVQSPVSETPLTSIFTHVRLNAALPGPLVYHQTPWSQDDHRIFPCAPDEATSDGKALLRIWLDRFFEMLHAANNFPALYAGTLGLIDEYLWSLPIIPEHADVSLAEIARLKSAVAACLFKQSGEVDVSPEKPLFTLLVGDLSGIQRYVFDITEGGKSKEGTARRLRSRSLFVQLLAEIGMHQALAVYSLPLANILMASGGKFQILWPWFPDNQQQIESLQHAFDTWLLHNLHGEVSLVLAHTTVTPEEMQQGFSQVIDRAETELWLAKNQKFVSVLQQNGDWNEGAFIRPVDFPHGDCPSCGKFPVQKGKEYCRHCELDRNVGRQIGEGATRVACYAPLTASTPSYADFTLPVFGWNVTVLTPDHKILDAPDMLLQLGGPLTPSPDYPVLWRSAAPYVVRAMDFTAIAESEEGRPLLGYLKADVDHLGQIFEWGFRQHPEGDLDLPARFSMLSRQIERFFGTWLSQYLRTNERYHNTYTVFAGGDDVFLVGH